MPVLPDVPTVAELGFPGFEASDWKMVVAPAGTPAAVITKINAEIERALGRPEMIARLLADGSAPLGGSPQKAAKTLIDENKRWGAIIRDAKIKPQ